jgi:hypothetical protein
LTFYPSKKNSAAGRAGYQKKRNFALISKMCRSLEFGKREKKFYKKTEFWELLYAGLLHIFEISAKFRFFKYPARPISKKFFFNSYKGGCCFFRRIKAQIR